MGGLPQDRADRVAALERWADQQAEAGRLSKLRWPTRVVHRLLGEEGLRRSRAQMQRVTLQVERVTDPLRDRTLNTASRVKLPEHAKQDRVSYAPSAWHFLPRALRYLGVSDDDTFVDFGCGKGRVVHQAARRPFSRVIGVEVSPELAAIARAVVEGHRHRYRCRNVEIVVADVRHYRVPDDLTIGYFFRPVLDESFNVLLRGIIESIDRNPRRVRLIDADAWMPSRKAILATGRFRAMTEQSSFRYGHTDRVAIFESL